MSLWSIKFIPKNRSRFDELVWACPPNKNRRTSGTESMLQWLSTADRNLTYRTLNCAFGLGPRRRPVGRRGPPEGRWISWCFLTSTFFICTFCYWMRGKHAGFNLETFSCHQNKHERAERLKFCLKAYVYSEKRYKTSSTKEISHNNDIIKTCFRKILQLVLNWEEKKPSKNNRNEF